MTASESRRRRSTWIGLVLSVFAVAVTGVLALFAVDSMADSRAGRDVSDDTGRVAVAQSLPWTSTALVGVITDDGRLASTAVAVLPPDGRGGTIVSLSSAADAASGTDTVIRPLGAVFEVDGPEAWRAAVEQVTGLSFDAAEVVDEQRFRELIGPLGDLPTVFPFQITDDVSGETFEAGPSVLSTAGAFRALTAINGEGPDWQFDPARDAVWDAIADRVGAGIGSLPEGVRFDAAAPPVGLGQFLDALFAAPVTFRGFETVQIDPSRVAEQLPIDFADLLGLGWDESVVTLNRGEVALVFASIAPARVAAPLEGPTVRLVSGFTEDDLEPLGVNRTDLLIDTIDVLLFTRSNVLSVVDQPGAAVPERTTVLVSDAALIDGVWDLYGDVFGEMRVMPAPVAIDGIELEITLGREYLASLEPATDVAGSTS